MSLETIKSYKTILHRMFCQPPYLVAVWALVLQQCGVSWYFSNKPILFWASVIMHLSFYPFAVHMFYIKYYKN